MGAIPTLIENTRLLNLAKLTDSSIAEYGPYIYLAKDDDNIHVLSPTLNAPRDILAGAFPESFDHNSRNNYLMKELDIAKAAARAGGDIAMRHFRKGVPVRSKGSAEDGSQQTYNLVSDADVETEHAIVELIRKAFPQHAFLGEESHQADILAEHLWIIDPIDGTTNFVHGIPHFAISIAYYQQGTPICGVIYNPARDDWFETVRGQGAFVNGVAARVGQQQRLDEVLIGTGFYYDRGAVMESTLGAVADLFRQNIHGIRRLGTASLDLVQVGCGMFGAFFEFQLSPWDFAAGRLFVEEAGGRISTCTGAPIPLALSSLLASNGSLHEDVLGILSGHFLEQPG